MLTPTLADVLASGSNAAAQTITNLAALGFSPAAGAPTISQNALVLQNGGPNVTLALGLPDSLLVITQPLDLADGVAIYPSRADGSTADGLQIIAGPFLLQSPNAENKLLSSDGHLAMPTLPVGTLAAPPAGLAVGDLWLDTTTSAQYPTVRVRRS